MPLRDYQQDGVHETREAIIRSDSAVYVLATGAGKTPVAGEMATACLRKGQPDAVPCT